MGQINSQIANDCTNFILGCNKYCVINKYKFEEDLSNKKLNEKEKSVKKNLEKIKSDLKRKEIEEKFLNNIKVIEFSTNYQSENIFPKNEKDEFSLKSKNYNTNESIKFKEDLGEEFEDKKLEKNNQSIFVPNKNEFSKDNKENYQLDYSNYLRISLRKDKDNSENISTIRIGKSFSGLFDEFKFLTKIIFSNFNTNELTNILNRKEKFKFILTSEDLSKYSSINSSINSCNIYSNFRSKNKNKFSNIKQINTLESIQNISNISVTNFSNKKNIKKENKKTLSLYKNLVYIPITSLSGEIKNCFTLLINNNSYSMKEISLITPYFSNLYNFLLNFSENIIEKEQKSKEKISLFETFNEKNKNKTDNINKENTKPERNKNLLRKNIEKIFIALKKLNKLEIKIILNPLSKNISLSFFNVIKINEINYLLKFLDFPNQKNFENLFVKNKMYINEAKINLKNEAVKLYFKFFPKNSRNFPEEEIEFINLFVIFSEFSECFNNKKLNLNKIKKNIYDKLNEENYFSQIDMKNIQIYLKFNIEDNSIRQMGICSEKNEKFFDLNLPKNIKNSNENPEENENIGTNFIPFDKDTTKEKIKLIKEMILIKFCKSEEEIKIHLDNSDLEFIEKDANEDFFEKENALFDIYLINKENIEINREYEI